MAIGSRRIAAKSMSRGTVTRPCYTVELFRQDFILLKDPERARSTKFQPNKYPGLKPGMIVRAHNHHNLNQWCLAKVQKVGWCSMVLVRGKKDKTGW